MFAGFSRLPVSSGKLMGKDEPPLGEGGNILTSYFKMDVDLISVLTRDGDYLS